MSAEYIKAFVIGSSWLVFVLFFYAVEQLSDVRTYSFKNYAFEAPLFLGLLNVFGLFISKQFDLSRTTRFLLTGIIGAIIIAITITVTDAYNFKTNQRWLEQYFLIFLWYIFAFFVVVNTIDYYLNESCEK
jgi:magnesium-transporting ATPase (P-type)